MENAHGFDDVFLCDPPDFLPDALRSRLLFISCLRERQHRSVYLVKDHESGEKAVLKITNKESADSAKSESHILSTLKHACIPRCILFIEDEDGREYLLRSYMEGDILNHLLERDGVFSEEQILSIVIKICSILHYLHSQQPPIIYRDINPDNITLTANGKISLFDFGISETIEVGDKGKAYNTVLVGTIPFISPEQMGFGRTDRRSDIFSIGKLMLYLKSGQTDLGTFFKSDQQAAFGKIIEKCTKQSKEKRFASIRQLEKAIKKAQKKSITQAFIKGVIVMSAFVLLIGSVVFTSAYYARRSMAAYPAQVSISMGAVDPALPIKWPELIVAVREALHISPDIRLTQDMLAQVTHIEIAEEKFAEVASEIGRSKTMLTLENLSELQYFENLTSLSLQGFSIETLEPIAKIKLESLNLSGSRISGISSINRMASLTYLDLSHTTISDIQALAGLPALSFLDLSYTYTRDISPLESLEKLSDLSLYATRVTDFSTLAKLATLKKLRISHVQIKDFAFLSNLSSLTHLELRSTGFSDLNMIASKDIEALDISLNYNYLKDISSIHRFLHLRELDISLNQIQDYTTLYALPELKTLGIDEGQSSFLIENMDRLQFLSNIILTAEEIPPELKAFAVQYDMQILLRAYYDTH